MSEKLSVHGQEHEQVALQEWPDQVFYGSDGEIGHQPPAHEYEIGNPASVVAPHRDRIVETVFNNNVTIIRSPTGTGKTTEISMYLLEHIRNNPDGETRQAYFTQPRIVAATATTHYERERLQAYGLSEDEARQSVGFHTAPHSDYDSALNTVINMTDGIPVQKLINGDIDPQQVVLVIDEAHEEKENMHILMLAAKKIGIRLVVMSATVDVDAKAAYFANEQGEPAPIIDIEGTTYPIDERVFTKTKVDKETGEAIEERHYRGAFESIQEYGVRGLDMLLFVTDIRDVKRLMARASRYLPNGYTIVGLHGEQSPDEQAAALRDYPNGKLIVATSIAMTSLTPNVDVVLDSGMSRAPIIDNGANGLSMLPSSLAERDQRRGRCGRTRPGIYELVQAPGYPAPLDRDELEAFSLPEVQSKRPDELIMKLLAMGYDTTSELIASPEGKESELAIRRLKRLCAVAIDGYYQEDNLGTLTETGRQMAELPLEANIARMVVESYKYSEAIQLQMIAAAAAHRGGGVHSSQMTRIHMSRYTRELDNDILAGLDLFVAAAQMNPEERQLAGFSEKKFTGAWEAFTNIAGRRAAAGEMSPEARDEFAYRLTRPTDIERAQLQACMMSGIDELYVGHGRRGQLSGGHSRQIRRRSKASMVYVEKGDLIAGSPYNLRNIRGNQGPGARQPADTEREDGQKFQMTTTRLVASAFRVDLPSLRQFAPERLEDRRSNEVRANTDGSLEERIDVLFDGRPIHRSYWRPVSEGAQTGDFLVDNLFNEELTGFVEAPDSILAMRQKVAELRELQHRTDTKIDIDSAVERMKEIVRQNMKDDDTAYPDIREVSFDTSDIISDDERSAIMESAPEVVELFNEDTQQFVDVEVNYHNNVAYLTLHKEHYPLLGGTLPELEGRKVMVRPVGGYKYVGRDEAYAHRHESRRDLRGSAELSPEELLRRRETKQAESRVAIGALRRHSHHHTLKYNPLGRGASR